MVDGGWWMVEGGGFEITISGLFLKYVFGLHFWCISAHRVPYIPQLLFSVNKSRGWGWIPKEFILFEITFLVQLYSRHIFF